MYITRLQLTESEIELLKNIFDGLHWYELCLDEAGYYLKEKDTGNRVAWENGLACLWLTRDKSIEEESQPVQHLWNHSFGQIDIADAAKVLLDRMTEGTGCSIKSSNITEKGYHKRLHLSFNDTLLFHTMFDDKLCAEDRIVNKSDKDGYMHLRVDNEGYYLESDISKVKSWEEEIAFLLFQYEGDNGSIEEDVNLKEWWESTIFSRLDIRKAQNEFFERMIEKVFEEK